MEMNKNQLEGEIKEIISREILEVSFTQGQESFIQEIISLFTKRQMELKDEWHKKGYEDGQAFKGKAKREAFQLGLKEGKKVKQEEVVGELEKEMWLPPEDDMTAISFLAGITRAISIVKKK